MKRQLNQDGGAGGTITAEDMDKDFMDVKPDANQAANTQADKLAAEKTASDKAAADKTAAEKTTTDKAAADKAEADKTEADKTEADKANVGAQAKETFEVGEGEDKVTVEKTWSANAFKTTEGAPPPVQTSDELQRENEGMKKILEIPLVKAIVAASANGKDPFETIKGLLGTDPESLTLDQLFEMDLKDLGITEETEVAYERKLWDDLPKSEKIRKTRDIKNKLASDRAKQLSEFGSKELSLFNTNDAERKAAAQRTLTEYNQLAESTKGQKLYGIVEVTDEMVKGAQEMGPLLPKRKDGTVDPAIMLEFQLFRKYKGLILDAVGKAGAGQGYAALKKEIFIPENPGSASGRLKASLPTAEQMDKDFEETK